MEPRARAGRNRGQQNFPDSDLNNLLTGYGDAILPLESSRKVLDEIITDFITEICFESARAATLAGRQKVKIDDVKFACRKNPVFLGKIKDQAEKKAEIEKAKKLVDVNDDKISKSDVKGLEEQLGDGDDDEGEGSLMGSIKGKGGR